MGKSHTHGSDESHDHDHGVGGHDHGGHGHSHALPANERRIGWAAALTAGFMVVEAFGGLIAGSLALLADAGHMLTDAASLVLAWFAFRLARRPADWQRTYGFHRLQVLAAFTNGVTLFFLAIVIAWEAVERIARPIEVLGGPMLAIATGGLLVNIAAFFVLHGADRDNLNIRGALLHVLGDLLGSVAAIVAALVILWTGWTPVDPILSVLVAVLILRSAWRLVYEAGVILLEAAPHGLDVPRLKADLPASIPGLHSVHHVHAWSLTQERPLITLHARVPDASQGPRVREAIKVRLRERYRIDHATVEIEHEETCPVESDAAR